MFWLYLTIFAYLLFAVANLGDKLTISKYKTIPIAYAFYVGMMGLVTLVLIPFGVIWPGWLQVGWAIIGGITFVFGLYFMYRSIIAGAISQTITIIGGASPLFTFLLSYLFLSERLTAYQFLAFLILVIAIILISWPQAGAKFNKALVGWAVLASFFLASNYVLIKFIYLSQPFISGFVWVRAGGALTALIILLIPHFRRQIKEDWQQPKQEKGPIILATMIIGGLGAVVQNYAFSLASATIVNALQVIQYGGVFILSLLLARRWPVLAEKLGIRELLQKIFAIILIGIGLYFLALS